MKYTGTLLALAASAAATGSFQSANSFSCPGNTDNKCTDNIRPGLDFSDLAFGSFSSYKDLNWKGWSCGSEGSGKRFAPRTSSKMISGSCSSEKETSPSIGCGANLDKFSLGEITVKPEFDCDLEFHYDMPDGSTCKQRSACSKSGTTVKNTQCGGAKNVTIVYPSQPSKPKSTCSVGVHTISFECGSASSTVTRPATTKPATTTPANTKPTKPATTTPANTKPTKPATTKPAPTTPVNTKPTKPATTKPTKPATTTKDVETSTGIIVSTETQPTVTAPVTTSPPEQGTTSSETSPVETSPAETSPAETSPAETSPAETSPAETSPAETSPAETTPAEASTSEIVSATTEITSTYVTSFLSTSTVFTTTVSTITSCAETVTDCPARTGGVVTTVVTVALSTTICPVTETHTTVHTSVVETPSATAPETGVTSSAEAIGSTEVAPTGTTTATVPVETLPCPDVVPSCLNTFLFSVGCADNSDAACYCPDAQYIKNVFDCVYAHGESAEEVTTAILFIQGICAPYVPSNPAIATGATVTSYVTASATTTASLAPVYTTVTVEATTVVPCTNSAGSEIPSSSSTVVISTQMTVPQVVFTTGTGTGTGGSVGLVPATSTGTASPVETGVTGSEVLASSTLVTASPVSTGSLTATAAATATPSGPVTVNGGSRVTGGVGLALGLMGLIAAL